MNCKRYKSCKKVPCGCSKPTCPPEYCYNIKQNKKNKATTSKNWTNCNMIFAYNDKTPYHIKSCKKFLKKYKQIKLKLVTNLVLSFFTQKRAENLFQH